MDFRVSRYQFWEAGYPIGEADKPDDDGLLTAVIVYLSNFVLFIRYDVR